MRNIFNLALVAAIVFLAVSIIIKPNSSPEQLESELLQQEEPTMPTPEMQFEKAKQVIEESKSYTATLKTSEGDITIAFDNNTPLTTNNFVFLAQEGYYDNTIFHRVIEDFMIQGGDPTGTGAGNPGYTNQEDLVPNTEYNRGDIAMAKRGDEPAGTFGAQFFIMHKDYDLPKDYIVFGHVTDGLDVVDKIATAEVETTSMGENSKPVNPVTLESVTIESE